MTFDPTQVSVGDQLTPIETHVTRDAVVRYSGASTDLNPIHYSDRRAREIGLPGVVAHGMWTMGSALRVVTDWCEDPARVVDYFVRFTRPIQIPDDDHGLPVRFSGQVSQVAEGIATISLEAVCADQTVLGAARAQVRL